MHRHGSMAPITGVAYLILLEFLAATSGRSNSPFEEGSRGRDDIVVGVPDEELSLQLLVRVEYIVIDLDPVFLFEVGDHRRLDEIRPVVDVEDFLRTERCTACSAGGGARIGAPIRRWPGASRAAGDSQRHAEAQTQEPKSGDQCLICKIGALRNSMI